MEESVHKFCFFLHGCIRPSYFGLIIGDVRLRIEMYIMSLSLFFLSKIRTTFCLGNMIYRNDDLTQQDQTIDTETISSMNHVKRIALLRKVGRLSVLKNICRMHPSV